MEGEEQQYAEIKVQVDEEVRKAKMLLNACNKELLESVYKCYSRCYKRKKTQLDAEKCMTVCEDKIAKIQNIIEKQLFSISIRFEDCSQDCYNMYGVRYNKRIKKCVKGCGFLATVQVKDIALGGPIIVREFLAKQNNKLNYG